METNNSVGEICVKAHAWSKGNWHVGEKAHAERGESGNGSSSGDEIAVDDTKTQVVVEILSA